MRNWRMMNIMNNYEKLKSDALEIYKKSVEKMIPGKAIEENLSVEGSTIIFGKADNPKLTMDISHVENIYVLGVGKAVWTMAEGVLKILSTDNIRKKIADGVIITKDGHSGESLLKPLDVFEASHPVPDERGIKATREIISILKKAGEKDLVIFLVSGGGSALYESLPDGISLDDLKSLTGILLSCGAEIEEINTIRKQLSLVKGGKTAVLAYPSTMVSLILSDVLGSPLEFIASGPTVPDSGTLQDVEKILEKYKLEKKIPSSIKDFIREGIEKGKNSNAAEEEFFTKSTSLVIGDNITMTEAAKEFAESAGYNTMILSNWIRGEARFVGEFFTFLARQVETGGVFPVPTPCCIIASGEPTVTLRGEGKGGRCQEASLAFSMMSSGLTRSLFLAAGSDGTDGPNDAAGGIGSREGFKKGKTQNLNIRKHLESNDSYNYLKETEDLIITGPTGTNVNDLFLLLVE